MCGSAALFDVHFHEARVGLADSRYHFLCEYPTMSTKPAKPELHRADLAFLPVLKPVKNQSKQT
jgi:hypothetical protein